LAALALVYFKVLKRRPLGAATVTR
jgi:hypothetical protein